MKLSHLPPEWATEHQRARDALVRVDAALQREMRRTVWRCVAEAAGPDLRRAAMSAAGLMVQRLTDVVLRGRLAARKASASALRREVRRAHRLGHRDVPLPAEAALTRDDVARSRRVARSYAAAWLIAALRAIDERPPTESD